MRSEQLATRVCPARLEEWLQFRGRPAVLRSIRADDLALYQRFLARVTAQDLRMRFFTAIGEFPRRELERLTQPDYHRDMALIVVATEDGCGEMLAVAQACANPDNTEAEIAVLVRSDLKGQGLGALLLKRLIRSCTGRRITRITGQALAQNTRMLQLARKVGFCLRPLGYDLVEMALTMKAARPADPPCRELSPTVAA